MGSDCSVESAVLTVQWCPLSPPPWFSCCRTDLGEGWTQVPQRSEGNTDFGSVRILTCSSHSEPPPSPLPAELRSRCLIGDSTLPLLLPRPLCGPGDKNETFGERELQRTNAAPQCRIGAMVYMWIHTRTQSVMKSTSTLTTSDELRGQEPIRRVGVTASQLRVHSQPPGDVGSTPASFCSPTPSEAQHSVCGPECGAGS